MVYAMFMVFLLVLYIHTADCQTTSTTTTAPTSINGCSFANNIYSTNAAVSNQFQFPNSTSVILNASYAFLSSPLSISTFGIGLIYPFSTSTYLVPFPVIFNCASLVRSCQLKTIAVTPFISRESESILVQLTQFNYSSQTNQLTQMGLYLREGRYQLTSCLLNDGQFITDSQTIFNINIQYEKSVGTSCNPSSDVCGSSSLTTCSSSSFTCTCLSQNALVSYANSFYCADTLNSSNCSIFPTRCITWCNSTTNNLCICPTDTLKIQRNTSYVCELPVDSLNCSSFDNIRRCPLGQSCINQQCIDNILITTTNINNFRSSTDQQLRIALGVIAGLLGTSVLVLIGAFCWVRHRHKRHRATAEKSLSSSSASPTSSLYISPTQKQQKKSSLPNQVYQLPIAANNPIVSPMYRTDSFRQAVLSGYKRTNQPIEHVSTKRDSFVEGSAYVKETVDSPTYSTIQFSTSSPIIDNQNLDDRNLNQNIYQSFIPTSSSTSFIHAV